MDRKQIEDRFYRRILEVNKKIINVINCIPYSHSFSDQIFFLMHLIRILLARINCSGNCPIELLNNKYSRNVLNKCFCKCLSKIVEVQWPTFFIQDKEGGLQVDD